MRTLSLRHYRLTTVTRTGSVLRHQIIQSHVSLNRQIDRHRILSRHVNLSRSRSRQHHTRLRMNNSLTRVNITSSRIRTSMPLEVNIKLITNISSQSLRHHLRASLSLRRIHALKSLRPNSAPLLTTASSTHASSRLPHSRRKHSITRSQNRKDQTPRRMILITPMQHTLIINHILMRLSPRKPNLNNHTYHFNRSLRTNTVPRSHITKIHRLK